jgi:hypothetical protein
MMNKNFNTFQRICHSTADDGILTIIT